LEITEQEKEFVLDFVKAYNKFQQSPYVLNTALKDLNMNPRFEDRDTVESMVANPKNHAIEKVTVLLCQHLDF